MANNIWQGTTSNWGTAGNWSLAAVPVSTNDTYLDFNSVQAIDAGLSQSAVTLNSLNISQSYTGSIGTISTYLVIGSTTFNLGTASGGSSTGSRRLNINCYNSGAVINVFGSGQSATDSAYTPIRLLCTSAPVNVTGGSVGIALATGETSSVTTLKLSLGTVVLGAGVTTTTVNQFGGLITNKTTNTTTTVLVNGGTYIHAGTGATTTMTANNDTTIYYDGTGTVTTLNVNGTLDFSRGTGAVTVTNCNVYEGAKIKDPLGRVTFTNPLALVKCRLTDVTFDFGWSRSVQVS